MKRILSSLVDGKGFDISLVAFALGFLFLMSGADHDQMDRMRSYITNMCTGWDVEQVKSIVGETLHDIVDPLVFAEAAELIADHKLCGRDVVVVSASGEEIVAPIARALGATHAMATRMVVEEGRYTGEIAFYCFGEGKVEAIRVGSGYSLVYQNGRYHSLG